MPVVVDGAECSCDEPSRKIVGQVKELTAQELARFRAWFAEYDWNVWDGELGRDVELGKLDGLASEALADHEGGRTKAI